MRTKIISTLSLHLVLLLVIFCLSGFFISCGNIGTISAPAISSGHPVRDKILEGIRAQLRIRLELTEDSLYAYLNAANTTGNTLSFADDSSLVGISTDNKNYAQIVFGLVREISRLGAKYSFSNDKIQERDRKIRVAIVRLVFAFVRGHVNIDNLPISDKEEFVRTLSFGVMQGLSSSELTEAEKLTGLRELSAAVASSVGDAKWTNAEMVPIASAQSLGLLLGLRNHTLSSASRRTIFTEISESAYRKIAELTDVSESKGHAMTHLFGLHLAAVNSFDFTVENYSLLNKDVIERIVPVLAGLTGESLGGLAEKMASSFVRESAETYTGIMTAANLGAVYKSFTYDLIKTYETKTSTAEALDLIAKIDLTMKLAIASVFSGSRTEFKTAANAGVDAGLTEAREALNRDF